MRRPGERRRPQWPIARIGWKEAKRLIEKEGYTLLKLPDGHAELLTPTSEAYHYLTARSVKLLERSSRISGGSARG